MLVGADLAGVSGRPSPSPEGGGGLQLQADPNRLLVIGDHVFNARAPIKQTQIYQLRLSYIMHLYENAELESLQCTVECMQRLSECVSSFRHTRNSEIAQLFTLTDAMSLEQEVMAVIDHVHTCVPMSAHSNHPAQAAFTANNNANTRAHANTPSGPAAATSGSSIGDGVSFTSLTFAVDPDSDHPRPSNLVSPLMQCIEEQLSLLDYASRWVALQSSVYAAEVSMLTALHAQCVRTCTLTAACASDTQSAANWRLLARCLASWLAESSRVSVGLLSLQEQLKKQLALHRSFFTKWVSNYNDSEKQLSLFTTKYVAALQREQKAQMAYDNRSSSCSASKQESLQRTLQSDRVDSIQEKQVLRDACVSRNRELHYLLRQFDNEFRRVWSTRFNLVHVLYTISSSREDGGGTSSTTVDATCWQEWQAALQRTRVHDDVLRVLRKCGATTTTHSSGRNSVAEGNSSSSSMATTTTQTTTATATHPLPISLSSSPLSGALKQHTAPTHVRNKQAKFNMYKNHNPLLAE
jgi:hypothetical protein